jgi:hypothetical protein
MSKTVVVDFAGPNSRENRAFKREIVGHDRLAWPMIHLYEESQKQGFDLITSDIYLASPEKYPNAIMWRGITTVGDTAERVIKAGARPAIFMAFENPMYDCDFYWRIRKRIDRYDIVLMAKGGEPFVRGITKFQTFVTPVAYPQSTYLASNFQKKKFLTMINTNSRIHPLRRLYVTIANFLRPLPTLVNRELYVDRLEAISYFSKRSDFDLYGVGWERPTRYVYGRRAERYAAAAKKSWRGSVPDKLSTLEQYKFSICFENCIFSGWVTEKILDSMLAGCVPIYWGAPDIEEFIPANCYIDFKKFKNYAELEQFLDGMDEKTYQTYIDNINKFIASDRYRYFTQEKFAEVMIDLFKEYSPT